MEDKTTPFSAGLSPHAVSTEVMLEELQDGLQQAPSMELPQATTA